MLHLRNPSYHLLVKETIYIANTAATDINPILIMEKKVIFKNCALFTDCTSEINNLQIDNAKNIDIGMPI